MQSLLWFSASFIGCWGIGGDDKIVGGGINREISKTPYVVSVHLNDTERNVPGVFLSPLCSGTIVTAQYVITACRCVAGVKDPATGEVYPLTDAYPPDRWAFLAGAWDLHYPDYEVNPGHQIGTPEFIRLHPECRSQRNRWLRASIPENDLAVAKMTAPFFIDHEVNPVKIFSFDQEQFRKRLDAVISDERHVPCTVSGWGATWDVPILEVLDVSGSATVTTAFPDEERYMLKIVKMQPRYEEDCLKAIVRGIKRDVGENIFPDWPDFVEMLRKALQKRICALNKNTSPCTGDAGTGLICNGFIIGVNSFWFGCGTPTPGVFQSLLPALDWLKKQVCSVQNCNDARLLHTECGTLAAKAYVEKCQTTQRIRSPKPLSSSVTPNENTRWLLFTLASIIH